MKNIFLIFIALFTLLHAETPEVVETVYSTKQQALKTIFKGSTQVSTVNMVLSPSMNQSIQSRLGWSYPETSYTIYEGVKEDKALGYALVMDEMGKHYPMTFMVQIKPDMTVGKVVFMVYRETVGAEVRKNRFLKQFKNKSSLDTLTVDSDINGISGATISSWAVTAGVKKALIIIEETMQNATKEKS